MHDFFKQTKIGYKFYQQYFGLNAIVMYIIWISTAELENIESRAVISNWWVGGSW